MQIKKMELLNALESVKPGLASKEIVEQSTCFVFQNNQIAAYNDVVAVSFPFELGVEGAVVSKELISLMHKVKDKEIEVYEKDNEFRIDGEKFKSAITMEKEIALPLDFLKTKIKFKPLPEGFEGAIKACAFSAAKETDYPNLSNIHIDGDIVESCDNFRATRCKIKKMKEEVLFPASAIRGLLNYHFDHYGLTDGWIHLTKENGAIFSCRTYKDKYPNLKPFFIMKGRPVRLPKELSEILDRSDVFSLDSGKQETITIHIKPKEIVVRGENQYGWFEETADVKRRGKETFSFATSPRLLKDILKHSSRVLIGERSMLFKAKAFDHSVVLIPKGEGDGD